MTQTQLVSPLDFRLTFAPDDCVWASECRPGLPILRWPDGALCEPVISWFGWSAEIDRIAISSMRPEAYALREWLAFMSCHSRAWDRPDDGLLRLWRESHASDIAAGEIKKRQVERKIDMVFCFYHRLHEALPLNASAERRWPLTGHDLVGDMRLTSKTTVDRNGRVHEGWVGSKRTGETLVRRPTPDPTQVDRVLNWLRASPDRKPAAKRERDRVTSGLRAERDWLVARCMVEGGLRAEEVTRLSLRSLTSALRTEECISYSDSTPISTVVDNLSSNGKVLDALERLRSRHRRCLYLSITGKGDRTRQAPFTIDLVRDLIAIGINHVRQSQLIDWRNRDANYEPPPLIFLSFKTRHALDAGTISDRMKEAFNGAKVDGSGHRLRAHYATAIILWDECFSINGFRFDQTVVNLVMERLAEALGHSRVTTTIRHYVDMALLRHFGPPSRGQLDVLRVLWNKVVQHRKSLSDSKLRLLVKSVEVLAGLPEGSEFEQVLSMALNDPDLTVPVSNGPAFPKPPRIKLV